MGLDVNITITRDTYTKNSVIGKINVSSTLIPDTYLGNTLEDAIGGDCQCKDPISQGKYNAFIRKDHNPNRIELKGVPNYTNVQIHIGNSARDVKGCFAVGDIRGLDFVGGSRPAMNKILDIIRKDGSENITVNVIGPSKSTATP
jgi:hypothetical protein